MEIDFNTEFKKKFRGEIFLKNPVLWKLNKSYSKISKNDSLFIPLVALQFEDVYDRFPSKHRIMY